MSTTITVTGRSGAGCEKAVEAALRDVSGVSSANADRANETATVEDDADPTEVADAVQTTGYDARA